MAGESFHTDVENALDLQNLSRPEFVNAMVHLYRGELGEATSWRSRIDTTSQWAVILSTSALTFIFSEKSGQRQVVIPIVMLFCTFLLLMESRRYRFYDIFRSRARLIEINFYRPLLDGSPAPTPHWRSTLAHDMEWPHFHMPLWEAAGRRLRRNYQWIYAILLGSWLVILYSFPTNATSFTEMVSRAAIGPWSGRVVFAGMVLFYGGLAVLAFYSLFESRVKKSLPAGHPGRMGTAHHE